MVKDVWNSFKDNIKDRITNPFLGTFIIVWIAHNWEVVYSFFYFDKGSKLETKIKYFKDYWGDKSFFWNLMYVAAITLGILIITYLFLAFSRYLANLFENVVVPVIHKISKGKIVTAETHQVALDRIISLEAKVEAERKAKNEAISERDEFEKKAFGQTEKVEIKDEAEIIEQFDDIIEALHNNYKEDEIEKTFVEISKRRSQSNDNGVADFLLKYGFIIVSSRTNDGSGFYYNFTKEGDEFRRQYFRKY